MDMAWARGEIALASGDVRPAEAELLAASRRNADGLAALEAAAVRKLIKQ